MQISIDRSKTSILYCLAFALFLSGCGRSTSPAKASLTIEEFQRARWDEIVAKAAGNEVRFGMWAGDEARNRFYQSSAADTIKQRYGINLRIVPVADTAEMINKLLNEKSAGKIAGGSIDMLWINGENFRTAKQGKLLWGPFIERLPNLKYFPPEATERDFGTTIDGYEAPYLRGQFVFAYDTARFPEPPKSVEKLRQWVKAHPGRFTYIAPPDFTGSAFIRHLLIYYLKQASEKADFDPSFDEQRYQKASSQTLAFLNDIKPFLWRSGETYPGSLKEADRLFANREIDFTMNYGPSFASEHIARGEYPATVRTFVLDEGTIANYSYLAIPFNATNPAGALVVINHLMSPAHAMDQSRTLGSLFPLSLDNLTREERAAAQSLPRGSATLSIDELAQHQVSELDAEYLERLEKDWRINVLQQ